jgi:hypothetical protein
MQRKGIKDRNEESEVGIVSRAVERGGWGEYGIRASDKDVDAIRHRRPQRSGGRGGEPSSYTLY